MRIENFSRQRFRMFLNVPFTFFCFEDSLDFLPFPLFICCFSTLEYDSRVRSYFFSIFIQTYVSHPHPSRPQHHHHLSTVKGSKSFQYRLLVRSKSRCSSRVERIIRQRAERGDAKKGKCSRHRLGFFSLSDETLLLREKITKWIASFFNNSHSSS